MEIDPEGQGLLPAAVTRSSTWLQSAYSAGTADEEALSAVARSWGAARGTPEGDRLDVLIALVVAYEAVHHPIPPPHPVAAIEFRMDQAGLVRADLEPYIGSESLVSDVLEGRHELSEDMIRHLHEGLGIPLESPVTKSGGTNGPVASSEHLP